MDVTNRHHAERQGVALVQALAVTNLRWLFREQSVSDIGIDAHLEVVAEGRATGRLLALQIKSGDSYFRESAAGGFVYRGDNEHLEYWLKHVLPVVVVICRPNTGEVYWQVISEDTVNRTYSGWKIVIPVSNRFGSEAAESLRVIATRRADQVELGGPMDTPKELTHADSILGTLLANQELLDTGRCAIQTSSTTYMCCRIATVDELVAVLVTAKSIDGNVFILQQYENRWGVAAQLPLSTKSEESVSAFFVRFGAGYCLVVRHPTSWGTGTLLYEEKWFLLSKKPRLILEYPVQGYVVGWGLLFDRQIEGIRSVVPPVLSGGTLLDLTIIVKYSPSSDVEKYEGVDGFNIVKTIRLEWNDSTGAFSVLPTSDMSPEETLGLYGDDDAGFVTRNLHILESLARGAGGGLLTWLEDLTRRANLKDRDFLCRVLSRRTE